MNNSHDPRISKIYQLVSRLVLTQPHVGEELPGNDEHLLDQILETLTVLVEAQDQQHSDKQPLFAVSNTNLWNIMNSMLGCMFIADLDSRISLVNEAACRLLGYQQNELLGQPLRDLFVKPFTFEDASIEDVEERIVVAKDGRKIPLVCSKSLLRNNQNQVEGYICIGQDISERKLIEQSLLLTQFCVDHASIGIIRTGSSAEILSVNHQFCQMLGYTAEELCNLHVYDFDPNFPFDKWQQHRNQIRHTGSDTFETIHRRKDGTLLPVEITSTYVLFEDKEFSFSFIQDITERKQIEQQRLELVLERERMAILQNFITRASHEFRTPLSVISTSAYLLKKTDDSLRQKEYIDKIEDQAKDVAMLVDALTTMSVLDGIRELSTEELDLCALIAMISATSQSELESKNIRGVLALETQPLLVQADSDYLQQAVEAVFDNAIRFAPEGSTITLRADSSDGYAVIEISNSGEGISEEDLPHIFEHFYRADKVGKTRGVGLGLPIAKKIIELHQGSIEVQSTINDQTTFTIWLPLACSI